MIAFINFLRSNLLFNEAVGCDPAWWNLVFSAEKTHLVKWWVCSKSSNGLLDQEVQTVVIVLPLWENFPNYWMDALSWENWWLQPFLVPSIPSFLMNQKLLYHLHTASLRLVKILCGQSGRLPVGFNVCRWWRICCSCNDWWVVPTWKVLV